VKLDEINGLREGARNGDPSSLGFCLECRRWEADKCRCIPLSRDTFRSRQSRAKVLRGANWERGPHEATISFFRLIWVHDGVGGGSKAAGHRRNPRRFAAPDGFLNRCAAACPFTGVSSMLYLAFMEAIMA